MERFVEIEKCSFDVEDSNLLRPSRWSDYVGQEQTKKNLQVFIAAAKKRGEPLDHMLFFGPPGLGKTTLAHIIAEEMREHSYGSAARSIEKAGACAA
ncbi:MAG: AAA family ATPase, partial [Helicobacter sp.]|nr:AAA family ATPase [Helicobacter sp.]